MVLNRNKCHFMSFGRKIKTSVLKNKIMKNNEEWKILKITIGKLLVISKSSRVMLRIHIKKPRISRL